jgi:hypothetical protein
MTQNNTTQDTTQSETRELSKLTEKEKYWIDILVKVIYYSCELFYFIMAAIIFYVVFITPFIR